ncbi:hypothetical protein [Hydrogenophaga sp.]|uniref:hypothetical protein n=1 Tax=Hydrogenophaga sp. TaxID=1904254 RepID=UPI003AF8EE1D
MEKIPFTSYDFWAYLSAGFLLLFVADQVAGTGLLARDSWTIVQGVVAVASAYAVGQLVASCSSFFFERLLVGKLLGFPRDVVFGRVNAPGWLRACMPGYFKELPEETRKRAIEKATLEGVTGPGESMFWAAYGRARSDAVVMNRLDNFLNLYGFCRNTALVAFLDAALLYWSYSWNGGPEPHLQWSLAALAVGFGMTFRYLKFFRHYAVEVFTSYAHSKSN